MLIDSRLIALNFKGRGVEGGSASDSCSTCILAGENLFVGIGGNEPLFYIEYVVVSAVETFGFLAVVATHGIIITVNLIYFIDNI